jgi:hypothetical protein
MFKLPLQQNVRSTIIYVKTYPASSVGVDVELFLIKEFFQ